MTEKKKPVWGKKRTTTMEAMQKEEGRPRMKKASIAGKSRSRLSKRKKGEKKRGKKKGVKKHDLTGQSYTNTKAEVEEKNPWGKSGPTAGGKKKSIKKHWSKSKGTRKKKAKMAAKGCEKKSGFKKRGPSSAASLVEEMGKKKTTEIRKRGAKKHREVLKLANNFKKKKASRHDNFWESGVGGRPPSKREKKRGKVPAPTGAKNPKGKKARKREDFPFLNKIALIIIGEEAKEEGPPTLDRGVYQKRGYVGWKRAEKTREWERPTSEIWTRKHCGGEEVQGKKKQVSQGKRGGNDDRK